MNNMNKNEPYSNITNKLIQHAETIDIPDELDLVVQRAIQKGKTASKVRILHTRKWTKQIAAAVMLIVFVGASNLSPTFAKFMSDIPVLGALVKVVSFRQVDYHEDTYEAIIDTPKIEGLVDQSLQDSLNQDYAQQNKELFDQFQSEVDFLKTFDAQGHLGLNSGFTIKTNNDHILSIGRYIVNTTASSSSTVSYITLDKQTETLITLPSLFKDDSYISIISENIKSQMREEMAANKDTVYWIKGESEVMNIFDVIDANQSFYISEEGKLVISFDKYTVGPGSMGIQEFQIPTQVIQDILIDNAYIH